MKFDLTTPCKTCPFRTNCMGGWLGRERAQGIANALDEGSSFTCHNTRGKNSQQCAGALIMLKRAHGGFSGALSVACALGLLRYQDLDLDAPIFDSLEAFVQHHTRREFDSLGDFLESLTNGEFER